MKILPISNQKTFSNFLVKVDDEDYENLLDCRWFIKNRTHLYYAFSAKYIGKENGKQIYHRQYLHRRLMNVSDPKICVDHIDGDGLNNQKSNLRLCTHAENIRNCRLSGNTTSKYRGVSKRYGKWIARLRYNTIEVFCKSFNSETEAALAYNEVALRYFGEFARLNIIEDPSRVTI